MPTRKTKPGSRTPKRAAFDYTLDFNVTDFRRHPELYHIGKGAAGAVRKTMT